MIWLKWKPRLIAAGIFLLTVLAAIARHKYVLDRLDKAIEAKEAAEREVKERRAIDRSDAEIESKYSDLEREAERDLKAGKMPDVIRHRNNR